MEKSWLFPKALKNSRSMGVNIIAITRIDLLLVRVLIMGGGTNLQKTTTKKKKLLISRVIDLDNRLWPWQWVGQAPHNLSLQETNSEEMYQDENLGAKILLTA